MTMESSGMAEQSDEQRAQYENEAVRIVKLATEKGLTLRVLGSLAFQLQCQRYGHLQKALGRAYTDIDFAGYRKEASLVGEFFTSLGYREEAEVNIYFAGQRMIFHHPRIEGFYVDVFFDHLNFCHRISWVERLHLETLTLPLAEMLLEKMQIVQINEKDIIDTIALLLEHTLEDHDDHAINLALISRLCARDWGLWRTTTMNLKKVAQMAQGYDELSEGEKARVAAQVDSALDSIDRELKSIAWKLRSKIGDRVKWYQEVDETG
jgi:hypothetical protein